MTQTSPVAMPPRNPVDEALDAYTAEAAASGDAEKIEDAARQQLIRGHRFFDSLVVMMRVNRIPVRPHRQTIHADKLVMTGSMYVTAPRSLATPATRAEALARLIADDLRLPRLRWTCRIMTLASEFAQGEDLAAEASGDHRRGA
jgi:hypothetical protein